LGAGQLGAGQLASCAGVERSIKLGKLAACPHAWPDVVAEAASFGGPTADLIKTFCGVTVGYPGRRFGQAGSLPHAWPDVVAEAGSLPHVLSATFGAVRFFAIGPFAADVPVGFWLE